MPFGIAGAASAGPRISHHVEEAIAKSSLPEIPVFAKAARESHFSITSELTAWDIDHDPAHLLSVIAMLQYKMHSQMTIITSLATEAGAAHGAMREIADELDRGGSGAGAVASMPGRTALASLSRRMPALAAKCDLIPSGAAAQAHPVAAALDTHSLLMQQELIFEQLQHLEGAVHDLSMGVGGSVRRNY
jgi:hypothetical protein